MSKEQTRIANMIKNMKSVDYEPKIKEKKQEPKNGYHIAILTDEDHYKIESVRIYSLEVGQEYTIEYDKDIISDALLSDVELMKKMVSYIYFIKTNTTIVPIKECIIVDVEDKGDSLAITFKAGYEEEDEERLMHTFNDNKEDVGKLIFISKM